MLKIIGLCGSRVKEGNVEAYLSAALEHAAEQKDVETELITLGDKQIEPCIHCNWCLKKQTREKFCAHEDDMAAIYPKLIEADGIVLASPAHFGRLSGAMADALDRTRAFVHGNVYRFPLKNKVGGALGVAHFRGAGLETTLASLDVWFLCHQMIVASSGLYQLGAGAYGSRNGIGLFEKEPRHMTLEDSFGLVSARVLMDRMIELIRLIKAPSKPEASG
jgi:multimeric flavodoxin WrbA